ncbi:MAG: alpha/beta hydrolase fold domain-containing protein [Gemmataceae bacterium]
MKSHFLNLLLFVAVAPAVRADLPAHNHKEDVIYGRKHGVALTMDVFTPREKANGLGVIAVVSGGWMSNHDDIEAATKFGFGRELLARGYTLFAVVHGSQPKYTILEAIDDLHRAIRFIRHNAKNYHIDPGHIGITGASAGCHLSLMMGVSGDDGNPKAKDPVDRESSRLQAVAGFFPPTDFFNYGKAGLSAEPLIKFGPFWPAFDFHEHDRKTNNWLPVAEDKRKEILKAISPAYHVTPKTPPMLLIHGDKDILVPLQQSQLMIEKLKEQKVPCELIVHKGGSHGWDGIEKDEVKVADWFDKYLVKKAE